VREGNDFPEHLNCPSLDKMWRSAIFVFDHNIRLPDSDNVPVLVVKCAVTQPGGFAADATLLGSVGDMSGRRSACSVVGEGEGNSNGNGNDNDESSGLGNDCH
jgi:hypothetical protein